MQTTSPSVTRVGLTLGIVLAPQFVGVGAPSVALTSIADGLREPFAATAWIIAGWSLASAIATSLVGRFSQRWGARRLLVGSVALVAIGSIVAALAPSLPILIAGRFVGGLGAGGSIVISYATIDGRLSGPDRARALAVIAAVFGTVSGAGTLIGGIVDQFVGWRAVLALPALSALALVPAARLALHDRDPRQRIDAVGAVLLTVVSAAVVTLLQAKSIRLDLAMIAGVTVLGVLAVALLVVHIRREPDGFVPRRVLATRGFVWASVVGLCIVAGYFGLVYAAPAILQRAFGWPSLLIGLVLLPGALASIVVARVTGRLASRFAGWRITAALGVVTAVGLLVSAVAPWAVIVGMALASAGFAGAQTVLVGLAPGLVDRSERRPALGLFNFLFYGGSAIGPAAAGGLSSVSLPLALVVVAVLPILGAVLSAVTRPGADRGRAG